MKIRHFQFFLLFFLLFNLKVNSQTKKEAIKDISKTNSIELKEAEAYYNFRKNLIVQPNEISLSRSSLATCGSSNNSNNNIQNIGFELGNFSNWNIQHGVIINSIYDSIINISPATSQILLTSGIDPITGFSYNSPFSGNNVIKLNDAISSTEATFMSTKFVVTSSNNILKTAFSFVHATVGHACSGNPYFRIQLFACNRTNLIKEYLFIPDYGMCSGYNPSFFNQKVFSPSVGYYTATDWKKVCFDLRNYIGETVELNVIVSDCIYTGHFGYAYFDAELGYLPSNVSLTNAFSINNTSFTYSVGVSSQCFNQSSILQCQNTITGIACQQANGVYTTTPGNTFTLSEGGIYNVTETPITGCDFHNEIKINVKPTISITPPSATVCPIASLNYSLSGAKSYTVKINNVYFAPYGSPSLLPIQVALALTQNPSTITVIGSGGFNCIDSTSIVMAVLPITSLTPIYTPTICAGNSVLSVTGAVSYNWNYGSVFTQTYSVNINGAGYFHVVGTNSMGCQTAPSTFSILGVSSTPIILSGSTNPICSGDSSYISVSGASSYTWSNGYNSCCQFLKPTIANPNFTVIASNMCSPTVTLPIAFSVLPAPAANSFTINFNSPVCPNTTFSVQGVGSNFYMKWGFQAAYSNSVNAYVTSANPTFTAIAMGSNGCNTQSIITMPLLPTPTLGVTGSTAICSGQSATLNALGANSYTWDYFQASSTYTTGVAVNNFNVALTGTNSFGCSNTTTFPIIVEQAGITATPNTTFVCLGANTLTLSATNLGSGGTYSWSTGATTQSIVVTPTTTTTYSVIVNSPACGVSNYSTTINVIPSLPPVLSYSIYPSSFCTSSPSTITVSGANSYVIGSMFGSSNTNTLAITTNNSATAVIIGVTGTYTNGCSTYTLLSFPINPNPYVGIYTPYNNICKTSTLNLTATGALTYTWSNSTIGNVTTITPSINSAYSVIGSAASGCTASATSPIIVGLNSPTITVTPSSPTVCLNSSFTLSATVVGGNGFTWNSNTTGSTITTSVNTPTVFSITSSTLNCASTKTVLINVYSPTSFSLTSPLCSGNLNTLTYSATPPGGTLFVNSVPTNTIYSNITATYNVSYMYQDTNNCVLSTNTIVTLNQTPCIKIAASSYTSCVGTQVTFTGTPFGGIYSGPNVSGNILSLPATGNYTVLYTYTDVNSCSNSICTEINSSICTDIPITSLKMVSIYPNPSHNSVTIDNPNGGKILLKIYDVNGKILYDSKLENTSSLININEYPYGLYIFYMESDTDRKYIKVIKD
ncbi:MAG: T9SS type A sorting domain-containing protein [Bacteroidetes bacterium]|nr:T9SS type A sorting domain-containing protein [Bacteroidota bacterium]